MGEVPKFTAIGVQDVPWKATHKHTKTGGMYRLLLVGRIAANLEPVVIYDNEQGEIWVRPEAEFFDGRFEPVEVTHEGA